MEKAKISLKRVFINNIDTYSSKHIAKFLSECVVGAQVKESNSRNRAFELVGTISGSYDPCSPFVLEQFFNLKREELLPKLMACDVIIYNITEHTDQVEEALWAVTTLHNEINHFTGPKLFILVSTVMTWACGKPIDPEDETWPFIDEDYRRRRPHPAFTAHYDLEKRVVKMGKTNKTLFSTCVVVSGMQYGMGEHLFHYFFKVSWQGQKCQIPVFEEGTNIIPTVHINDLASVIQNVIDHRPKLYYLLAVDYSNNTLEEIVQAISNKLGPGKIQKMPLGDAFLIREMSIMEIDCMMVNLRMQSVHLKEQLSIPWLCEKGLVENIDQVVEEYRQNRGLLPIRVCVLGPPAVGKSTVAQKICDHYKLHYLRLMHTISETISQLEETIRNDPEAEDESTAEAKELLNNLKESMEQNKDHLDEQLLVKVIKNKLMSKPCRNQGFVLDGLPQTFEQAKKLFESEEDEEEETSSSNKIIPEFVFFLDASDAFLKDRVMNLPEWKWQEINFDLEHFLKRLRKYRQKVTAANFYDKFNITALKMEITNSDEPDGLKLLQKIFYTVGPPRNYAPSIEELEEEERKKSEERKKREAQEKVEKEEQEAEEARERAACWEKVSKEEERLKKQEEEVLLSESLAMRNYMAEHVMPTLLQGLIACCEAQPEDPVDFLAEYLVKNNPAYRS